MQVLIPGNSTIWGTQNGIYGKIAEGHKTLSASSVHVTSSA